MFSSFSTSMENYLFNSCGCQQTSLFVFPIPSCRFTLTVSILSTSGSTFWEVQKPPHLSFTPKMIRFFLLGLAQACFRTNLDNLPSLETCSHELNFERKTLPKVNATKIVGGINAKNDQWPFISRLTVETDAGQGLCGGSIIDNNWILT